MPFTHLLKDRVNLVKQDGRRFEGIRASVQPGKIITDTPDIPVEEGDVFERALPNGVVERYDILDAGYYAGIGGIKAHYQSSVRKRTKIETRRQPERVVYNLIGPNARVNVHSVDASTNLVNVKPDELFARIREKICELTIDESLSGKLLQKVDEMEQTRGKHTFLDKYREFIALAADHITVLAPVIPALSQMLSS
jgi:hypothetical protein